jgi:hypothetical protein
VNTDRPGLARIVGQVQASRRDSPPKDWAEPRDSGQRCEARLCGRCWPGVADGTLTERVAFALQRDFLHAPAPHTPVRLICLCTGGGR